MPTFTFDAARLLELAAEHDGVTGRGAAAAIANRTGLDEGSISRYLSGKRRPGLDRAALMARAYQVELNELMVSAVAA